MVTNISPLSLFFSFYSMEEKVKRWVMKSAQFEERGGQEKRFS
jgi:hypothetical protein